MLLKNLFIGGTKKENQQSTNLLIIKLDEKQFIFVLSIRLISIRLHSA